MNVRVHPVGVYELLILRHMGKNPKLNLGIIRIRKNTAHFWHEHLSDFSSQLGPHGNILQIRVGGADAPRGRNGLVKRGVNPLILSDKGGKTVRIGALQLCKPPVFQHKRCDGMLLGKPLEHVRRGGISRFCLFPAGNPHLLKQDFPKLLGRVDVKLYPRLFVYFLFQLADSAG